MKLCTCFLAAALVSAQVVPLAIGAEQPVDEVAELKKALRQAEERITALSNQVAVLQQESNDPVERDPIATLPPARVPAPAAAAAPAQAPPAASVPLESIARDYVVNRAAADQKYRNRELTLQGVIESIEKDSTRPGYFNVYLKSPDPKVRFKLAAEFGSSFDFLRDKIGYRQSDVKIDLIDDSSRVALQMTNKLKSNYYYGYYYYGRGRTVESQKSDWLTIISRGQEVTVKALCTGKTIAVDFTNCKFADLKLPTATAATQP